MSILFQWIHVVAAVIGVGGMGFILIALKPSLRVLSPEQRELMVRAVRARFRWVTWGCALLLLVSGLYAVKTRYWEAPWGTAWKWLTVKLVLAGVIFVITLALTLPLRVLERVQAKRQMWLAIAFGAAIGVILISAYLRMG
ncbi:MAG TPA: hypothetical protein VKM93_14460 [Terriglobia bacterium]|nr:hypothetical protein [Terriglobia bacterium]